MQPQTNTIALQPEILAAIEKISITTHISKERLVQNAPVEMLEDFHDAKAAEEAIPRMKVVRISY